MDSFIIGFLASIGLVVFVVPVYLTKQAFRFAVGD